MFFWFGKGNETIVEFRDILRVVFVEGFLGLVYLTYFNFDFEEEGFLWLFIVSWILALALSCNMSYHMI